LENFEADMFALKARFAELINVVMESGEVELIDKIEEIVTSKSHSPRNKKREATKIKSVLS